MSELNKIAAEKLDLVMRDEDFVIYYDGKPFLTKGGVEFAHKNARVLKHILLKLTLNPQLPSGLPGSAGIFCVLRDRIENGRDFIRENFDLIFDDDFVVQAKFGKKHQHVLALDEALDYLDQNPDVMNLIFWSNSLIIEGFKNLISQLLADDEDLPGREMKKDFVKTLISEGYDALSMVQKAAINVLSIRHKSGIVLPLMLILEIISPSEYSNSTLAAHSKNSTYENENTLEERAVDFNVKSMDLNISAPLEMVSLMHSEALKTLEFLRFFSSEHRKISVISELINRGESDNLEFKSTFRWDIRQNKKNPAIEHASLKTMAAFINSNGGDLLIGVEDDGTVLGIETDAFPNDDKFLLHLWSLIKSSMGQDISPYIKTTLEKFDGRTVCRVHCIKSPKPVFLRQKGFDESFYIRIGPSTGSLEISEALKYISGHFKG